jgi:hypothetical protein
MFGHAVSHCQCSKIYTKLHKIAQICPNLRQLVQENLKFHQKLRFWFFSKRKTSMYRGGTKAWAHCLDFQSKNFPYAFFNVKKNGFCMWISAYPFVQNDIFFQGFICLVDMRFCWHVHNLPRNKNLKSFNPYLL